MDIEADLVGILSLMRTHIEVRNRSWMKRIHRDCFIGSDAVDFLVAQGLADTRKQAVEMGRKMLVKKMIRHVTDSQKFSDSYHYYRFAEDDAEDSVLASTNAGNGTGAPLGHGGCKWSFCPHTAHNSYLLDIALAEELERAVAGASVEARAHAVNKLRARVREQAEEDAPDWDLTQSTSVNNTVISIFDRKRPRGEWKNVKMTGMVGEPPINFVKGIMNFQKRKHWESMFEDGIVVETIDIGEPPNPIVTAEDERAVAGGMGGPGGVGETGLSNVEKQLMGMQISAPVALPQQALDSAAAAQNMVKLARKTDDVMTFLQTVDLAGVPDSMAIAFLNDPERQHALAHLRKQMMASQPQECMLCQFHFESNADIRFCPCCAMVSCAGCVRKRVFEVVSRQVVSVCVHCFRESSRIRHPPEAVKDRSQVGAEVRGKWWRPDELGIVDYSESAAASTATAASNAASSAQEGAAAVIAAAAERGGGEATSAAAAAAAAAGPGDNMYDDEDMLILNGDTNIRPLIPGILDDLDSINKQLLQEKQEASSGKRDEESKDEGDDDSESVPGSEGLYAIAAQPVPQPENSAASGPALRSDSSISANTSAATSSGPAVKHSSRGSDNRSFSPIRGTPPQSSSLTAQILSSSPKPSPPVSVEGYSVALPPPAVTTSSGAEKPKKTLIQSIFGGGSRSSGNKTDSAAAAPSGMTSADTAERAAEAEKAAASRTARCKNCGQMISREMEAIEAHMEECSGVLAAGGGGGGEQGRLDSVAAGGGGRRYDSMAAADDAGGFKVVVAPGTSKTFGGITRRPELEALGARVTGGSPTKKAGGFFGLGKSKEPQVPVASGATRIIYRSARTENRRFRAREVCAFQDCFVDPDGTCYVYEISVRHCDVRGTPDHVTADVMCLMHVAKPVRGSKGTCNIMIVSQVDTRAKGPQWLMSFIAEEGRANIGTLGKDDLVRELKQSENLQNILKREQAEEEAEAEPVTLDDFELLAVLGRGGFGKVMQVRHKPTTAIYAMKILKKSELRRRRQVERTQTERTILANVRHPFIVCLHFAFQNAQKLYMVMDFVQGGDFFTLMRKFKRIPEDWVRLYVIEVAMALQHLHDMDVVYRDLKPENILLCGDGHLKLTDFGLSRFFETRPPAPEDMVADDDKPKTNSFCGTEQYMSPEMLLQQGHNYRMDWWCLGLLMHEMISARHPFHGSSHYDTLRNMVTKPPTIDGRLSAPAAIAVKSMLVKNPRARLCCREGISELKALPFFQSVDWQDLYDKKIVMPYRPRLADDTDVSSFEATFTREKAIDSLVDPDAKDGADGKKKKSAKSGGLLGMFGLGGEGGAGAGGGKKAAEDGQDNSFKGFSFTKEENEQANAYRETLNNAASGGDAK